MMKWVLFALVLPSLGEGVPDRVLVFMTAQSNLRLLKPIGHHWP